MKKLQNLLEAATEMLTNQLKPFKGRRLSQLHLLFNIKSLSLYFARGIRLWSLYDSRKLEIISLTNLTEYSL